MPVLTPPDSTLNLTLPTIIEQRLKYEIARAYREHSGPVALRSKMRAAQALCAALATAIRELEIAAELTAGQAIQHHIDSKLPALRATLAAARRAA
jgi:hypothetical protein